MFKSESSLRFILQRIKQVDSGTYTHALNVAKISRDICAVARLSEKKTQFITTAALLHDVGKIAVPQEILSKPDKLTAQEYKEIQKHPLYGYACVNSFEDLKQYGELILYHHERWDGSGYPNGLAGEKIPLGARIIAVADTYEAMTATRVYRPPIPVNTVLEHLRQFAGIHFDPAVTQAFFKVLGGMPDHAANIN